MAAGTALVFAGAVAARAVAGCVVTTTVGSLAAPVPGTASLGLKTAIDFEPPMNVPGLNIGPDFELLIISSSATSAGAVAGAEVGTDVGVVAGVASLGLNDFDPGNTVCPPLRYAT